MTEVVSHPPPKAPVRIAARTRHKAFTIALISLIAAIAISPFAYWGIELYRSNWGVVVPGQIFRSAQMSPPLMRHRLEGNHIGVIIFLSHDDDDDSDVAAEKRIAAEDKIQFLNFPMMGDGVGTPQMYADALTALCDAHRSGKNVLVHCHSGAQRTGGVVAVYRMLVEKIPPERALAEMKHYGHDPRKNLTLIPFLNKHIGEWATALVKDGVIQQVPDPLPQLNPNSNQ